MNPQVAEYLRKKLAEEEKLAQITAESKAADAEANRQNRFAESLSRAAASFGSIGGRGPTSQLDLGQADSSADVLAQQAKVKGAESQYQLAQNLAKDEENDPESGSSKAARAMVSQYMPSFSKDPSFAMMSASQIKTMMPFMKEALESQKAKKVDWQLAAKPDVEGYMMQVSPTGETRRLYKAQTEASTKPPLTVAEKERLDKTEMAYTAAKDIEDALRSLPNQKARLKDKLTLGDTPYSAAVRRWEEAIGRLQSGGAITDDEGARFRAMAPGVLDKPEIAAQKVKDMIAEMEARLSTLGATGEQALAKRGRQMPPKETPLIGGPSSTAVAAPAQGGGELSEDERKELEQLRSKYRK